LGLSVGADSLIFPFAMSMSKVRRVEYVMMATGVLRLDEARKMCLLGQLRLNGSGPVPGKRCDQVMN